MKEDRTYLSRLTLVYSNSLKLGRISFMRMTVETKNSFLWCSNKIIAYQNQDKIQIQKQVL